MPKCPIQVAVNPAWCHQSEFIPGLPPCDSKSMMHSMGAEWQADLVTAELGSAEKPSEPAATSIMAIAGSRCPVPLASPYRYARAIF